MRPDVLSKFRPALDAMRRETEGKNLKYYVLTFGCQQNEADSEVLRGYCRDMGYAPADAPESADLILVNTCAIRKHAEDKALSTLGTFGALKKKKPSLLIGVCGCMAAEPGVVTKLKEEFHYVSFTMEPGDLGALVPLTLRSLCEAKRSFYLDMAGMNATEETEPVRTEGHRALVSIMYGCNNFCSYCIVPYVRGRERSRCSSDVIGECRRLVNAGVREITLLGQNVNSYRSDIDFPDLLERVAGIEGDFILRFMTSHPKDVSDKLIAVMAKYKDKIAPTFHLPLQSGSDAVLSAMNRRYTSAQYLAVVDKLRAAIPEITLTTDVIVAFPGESEEDFGATLDAVRRVRYDQIYSFLFSPREGTRAAGMENTISEAQKNDRYARLIALQKEISLEKNLAYEGRTLRVLCDCVADEGAGNYIGKSAGGKVVRFTDPECRVGSFVNVKITKATPFDLFGEAEQ